MNREEFREHARTNNVIPVFRKLLADGETPLGIYRKLAKNLPNTFLLESAEHGGAWSRYSFIGVRSQATLTERDGKAFWEGNPPAGAPTGMAPLEALRLSAQQLKSPVIPGLPTLTGGLVGYMGYDSVRGLEKLPTLSKKDLPLPELNFMLTSDIAVMDHADGTLILIANAINWDGSTDRVDEAYDAAVARLDRMQEELTQSIPSAISEINAYNVPDVETTMTSAQYKEKILKAKEEIVAGEAFQIVLSQRFATPCTADAIDVNRALRLHNPSP